MFYMVSKSHIFFTRNCAVSILICLISPLALHKGKKFTTTNQWFVKVTIAIDSCSTIGTNGFSMVFQSANHWWRCFSMVANHWSNDAMVTIHRSGLVPSISLLHWRSLSIGNNWVGPPLIISLSEPTLTGNEASAWVPLKIAPSTQCLHPPISKI